ncbi:hypothetical protein [Roseateles flavus]|uniref:Uncharacterized protein n=1 Tax=Roseateles flavus TaxID=3149041 RepID=A0ABV0GBZ2_9BURK
MDQKNMARTDDMRACTEGHPIKAEQLPGKATVGGPAGRLAVPQRAAVHPQAGHRTEVKAESAKRTISIHAVDATQMQVPRGDSLFGFAALGLASIRLVESAPCADAMKGASQLIKARARAGGSEKFQQQQAIISAFKKHPGAQGLVVMKQVHCPREVACSEGACR